MPNVTVTTDVDTLLKSADNAAARANLGLGTAAEAATGDFATTAQGALADSALQNAADFATAAQGALADSALQNAEDFATSTQGDLADMHRAEWNASVPTLDSITGNGATTINSITVGSKFATGDNIASGARSISMGGTGNTASGDNSEVLGGGSSTASGTGSTIVGGSSATNRANWTAVVGGLNHDVLSTAVRGGILGGYDHHLNHADSVILGGSNITTDAINTVFVPNLNIENGFKMTTGAADDYILTSDASGVGSWEKKTKVQTVSTTAGVLSFDYSAGEIVKTTLTESVTSIAITNAVEGASGMIIFETDGLATHSMTVSSPNKVLGGYQIDFDSLTVNDVITMGYYYTGTGLFLYISQIG